MNNQSNFTNCEKFDEFKDILIKLFKKDIKNKNANEVIKKMDYYDINKELIESIDDKYFFLYFKENNIYKVILSYLNNYNKISNLSKTEIKLDDRLFSISVSKNKDKVYACLLQRKEVNIFRIDLTTQFIEKSDEIIKENTITLNKDHFYKCLELSKILVATSDYSHIDIWSKNENFKKYIIIKKFLINTISYDLLLINEYYFISSEAEKKIITFYDIKNFILEKNLFNINSYESDNCLVQVNESILVKSDKIISIIDIKTKELIQIIQITDNNRFQFYDIKPLSLNNDIFLFILESTIFNNNNENITYYVRVNKFDIDNRYFNLVRNYKLQGIDAFLKPHIILCNPKAILIEDYFIYHLELN